MSICKCKYRNPLDHNCDRCKMPNQFIDKKKSENKEMIKEIKEIEIMYNYLIIINN